MEVKKFQKMVSESSTTAAMALQMWRERHILYEENTRLKRELHSRPPKLETVQETNEDLSLKIEEANMSMHNVEQNLQELYDQVKQLTERIDTLFKGFPLIV